MFWLIMFILLGFAYGLYVVFRSFTAETKNQAVGIDTDPTIEERLKVYLGEAPAPMPSMTSFQPQQQAPQQQPQSGFNFDNFGDDDQNEEDDFDFNFDDSDLPDFDFGRTGQQKKEDKQENKRAWENTTSFDSLFQKPKESSIKKPSKGMTFNEKRAAIQAEKDERNAKAKATKKKRRAAKAALDKLTSQGKFKFSPKDAIIYNLIMNNKYQHIDYD